MIFWTLRALANDKRLEIEKICSEYFCHAAISDIYSTKHSFDLSIELYGEKGIVFYSINLPIGEKRYYRGASYTLSALFDLDFGTVCRHINGHEQQLIEEAALRREF